MIEPRPPHKTKLLIFTHSASWPHPQMGSESADSRLGSIIFCPHSRRAGAGIPAASSGRGQAPTPLHREEWETRPFGLKQILACRNPSASNAPCFWDVPSVFKKRSAALDFGGLRSRPSGFAKWQPLACAGSHEILGFLFGSEIEFYRCRCCKNTTRVFLKSNRLK